MSLFFIVPPRVLQETEKQANVIENMTGNEKCGEIKFMETNIQLYTTEEKERVLTLDSDPVLWSSGHDKAFIKAMPDICTLSTEQTTTTKKTI